MSRGIYVALSGAVAQENALETTATNMANASSTGYQRLRPVFQEVLAKSSGGRSGDKPDPHLHYTTVATPSLDTTAGAIRSTGRSLDVALGDGSFLAVDAGKGERYTRAGALSVDKSGTLTIAGGAKVMSDAGAPIVLSEGAGDARIEPDGSVMQGNATVAKLKLVSFERPDRLTPEGNALLAVGGAGKVTPSDAQLVPGALTDSNAQPVVAMTELMTASRTFEAFKQALDTLGDVDRKVLTTTAAAFE